MTKSENFVFSLKNKFIVLFLLIFPFAIYFINPIFTSNPIGDWDVWMYYGYIRHLFQYSHYEIWPANEYIGTRITYFLPGHIVQEIFGADQYKLIFNIGICYSIIILSLYYIVARYTPAWTAFSISILLATDLYFLRSIGWDYVDKGVLAYEMLTLVCLTAAHNRHRRAILIIGAGFFATSMIFVHVASAIVFPVFFVYYAFVVQRAQSYHDWVTHFVQILLFGTIGAVGAQLLFGTLTILLDGGDFFFFITQLGVIQSNISGWNAKLSDLAAHGYWITVPLAAFVGAAISLTSRGFRINASRFEVFWLWAVLVLYGVMFAGEITGKLWLFSRDGMHSTILAPYSMIAFGIMIYRQPSRGMTALTLTVFSAALLLRLFMGGGAGLSQYISIPMLVLGLAIGLMLAVSFIMSSVWVSAISIVVIGLLSSFNPAHFADDQDVRIAHAEINQVSNGRLPSIFYSREDPEVLFIWSVLSSFTDRALFTSRETYPTLRDGLSKGDIVVIASSGDVSQEDARAALLKYASASHTVADFEEHGVRFYVFEVLEVK